MHASALEEMPCLCVCAVTSLLVLRLGCIRGVSLTGWAGACRAGACRALLVNTAKRYTTAQCTYAHGLLHFEQLASAADSTLSGESLTDLTALQCTCTVVYCTVLLGMHQQRWVVSYLRSGCLLLQVL
jgi:hypothetical protein